MKTFKMNEKEEPDIVTTVKIKPLSEDDIKNNALEPKFTEAKTAEDEAPRISLFKLFTYATSMDKLLISIAILSALATGALAPIQLEIFGSLTSSMVEFGEKLAQAANKTEAEIEEIKEGLLDAVTNFAIYNSYIGVGMLVLSYTAVALMNFAAIRQTFTIRGLFFKKTLNQDISWYDLHQTGDFSSRLSEDLHKLEEGIGEKIPMFIHHQVSFVGCLILAFVRGWELALICLISFPLTMIAMLIVSRLTSSLSKQELDVYGIAGAIAEEVLSSIKTVVAFGGQYKEIERYSTHLVNAREISKKRGFFSGLGFGMLWFFIYASYSLAFWYGVKLIIKDDNNYDAGTMMTVFFGVMMGSMNFGMSSPFIESFSVACGAGAKVFSVINRQPAIDSSSTEGRKIDNVKGSITFTDVHFQYPSRPDVKILRGLNLSINRGETVALVGSSGCGKSTCIQLIQRFYDPASGAVKLDDVDIKDLNVAWLRSQIGVVGQEPVLFGTTVAENIRHGNPHASQLDIENAARKANAHDFIMSLPRGYDTMVGERGAQMSGGQKQRIAIARALVREPAILLLDEATSALDTNSEAKVQKALDNASEGRTTIIVAHRLSTIRGANKIVVVSQGSVVEQGTHSELMALKSHYYNLVTTQMSNDGDDELDEQEQDAVRGFMRTVSVIRSDSTMSDKRDSYVPEQITDLDDVEDDPDKPKPVSVMEVLRFNKPETIHIFFACVGSFIMGAAMPLFAVLFGDIIGVLAQAKEDEDYVIRKTNFYSLMFLIVGIITGVATFIQQYMFAIAGENLTMRMRDQMFRAMVNQEMAWFDDEKQGTGTLCAKLSKEAASVQGATGQRIGTILQSLSTIAIAVSLSMYYQWRLGLVALAFTPFLLIATYMQRGLMQKESEENQKGLERATKIAVEAVGNIRTVVSLGRESAFHDSYMFELSTSVVRAKRNLHLRAFVFACARSLMFFAYAACMYYGGHLAAKGSIEFNDVFKVSQSLIMGTVSIANALAFAPNFQKGLIAAARIIQLLNRKPKIRDPAGAQYTDWKAEGDVDYRGLYFSYPSRPDTRVLRGLNLAIQKGKTIALVGPSGCGKSTTIQLLERFYDPFVGQITVDDKDIHRDLTLKSLRSQLGIVSQEPSLFDRTIAENIAYGDNTRTVTKEEIMQAAKNANIHNFIVNLPLGYETRLGDKGTQLSGGQKQRIAIARALVRNPRILLLDEATSALDTESEQIVQDALDKAMVGRTCITIAHRLLTIQDADLICVFNRGRISEMGTHQELLQLKGLYHKLYTMQSKQR